MITYSDGYHEFSERNLTTAVLVEAFQESLDLLGDQIDAHLSQAVVQLLTVNLSVVILINDVEHLGHSSYAKGASLAEHAFDLLQDLVPVVCERCWASNWLGGSWIAGEQDLPNIGRSHVLLREIDNVLSNLLVLQLLRLVLDLMLFATYFKLTSELVTVHDILI